MMKSRYWDNSGKYQDLYDQVSCMGLIPWEGESSDSLGEMLRRCKNVYYDIYNNGGCNPHRFEGMNEIVVKSDLDRDAMRKLNDLFAAAKEGKIEIIFSDDPAAVYQDQDSHKYRVCSIFFSVEFESELEKLLDWAVLQTWLGHATFEQLTARLKHYEDRGFLVTEAAKSDRPSLADFIYRAEQAISAFQKNPCWYRQTENV